MVQNSDITLTLTLKTSAGVNIDPTDINDYEFFIYYLNGNDKALLATYKKSNSGLYGITYDAIADTYTIIINRELTAIMPSKTIYIESLVQLIDATGIGGFKNISSTANLVTTMVSSANPKQLL